MCWFLSVSCLILNPWCTLFQEGSITQVACCPHDEDFIAVATRLGPLPEAKICLILIFPLSKFTSSYLVLLTSCVSLCWDALPVLFTVFFSAPVRVWWWCGSCSWNGGVVQRESVCPGSTVVTPSLLSAGTPALSEFLSGIQEARWPVSVQDPPSWAR